MIENLLLSDEMNGMDDKKKIGNVSTERKNGNNECETEILDCEGAKALRDKKNSE